MGEDVSALKLVKSIEENTKHYVEILSRAIDDCMPAPTSEVTYVFYSASEAREIPGLHADHTTASKTTSWMS